MIIHRLSVRGEVLFGHVAASQFHQVKLQESVPVLLILVLAVGQVLLITGLAVPGTAYHVHTMGMVMLVRRLEVLIVTAVHHLTIVIAELLTVHHLLIVAVVLLHVAVIPVVEVAAQEVRLVVELPDPMAEAVAAHAEDNVT